MAETDGAKGLARMRELSTRQLGSRRRRGLVASFKSFTANVYAFMYALQNKCWFIFTMCEILYAQLVPPVGLEPTLEGF